jgi:uncharacterized protein (DUF924 family)
MLNSNEILHSWFACQENWFNQSRSFDKACRRRFLSPLLLASEGQFDNWTGHATGVLALVLLFDPIPRCVFRGLSLAYEYDRQARSVSLEIIQGGGHEKFSLLERAWLYHPLANSEKASDQTLSLQLYSTLRSMPDAANARVFLQQAEENASTIARFGRFPERNQVLKRRSTPDEALFLAGRTGALTV